MLRLGYTVVILWFGQVLGDDCRTLDGVWHNDRGSHVTFNHSIDGFLSGIYHTAMESSNGSAGADMESPVLGISSYDTPGAMAAFSVMWDNGSSTTSWTGQCFMVDGEEVLKTAWLLRSRVDCPDIWESTLAGTSTFTRFPQTVRLKTPKMSSRKSDQLHKISERASPACASLTGFWYSERGAELHIITHENNEILGEHRTASEVGGTEGNYSMVYGIGNSDDSNTSFSMYLLDERGLNVIGSVGQCHICDDNPVEVLSTSWLLRSSVTSLEENWRSTLYGEDLFTRQSPPSRVEPHAGLSER